MQLLVDRRPGGVAVVRLIGRLDLPVATPVKDRLAKVVAEGSPRLVVDLGEVSFVDSSGLAALIGGLKAARLEGGDLRIASPNDQARLILGLTTLDRVLRVCGSVEEAVADYA